MTPELARLLADPDQVRVLRPETARALLLQLAPLQEALRLRALEARVDVTGQPAAPAENLQLLPVSKVTALLNLPRARVYELIRQGEIPALRVGEKSVRVPRGALQEWIARHQKKKA